MDAGPLRVATRRRRVPPPPNGGPGPHRPGVGMCLKRPTSAEASCSAAVAPKRAAGPTRPAKVRPSWPGSRSVPLASREPAECDEADERDDDPEPKVPEDGDDDPDDHDDPTGRDAADSATSPRCHVVPSMDSGPSARQLIPLASLAVRTDRCRRSAFRSQHVCPTGRSPQTDRPLPGGGVSRRRWRCHPAANAPGTGSVTPRRPHA